MSDTQTEARCPGCGGLFTPDQIRAANPTADCTFCSFSVLLRRPPHEPTPAPPPAMPPGLTVIETPPPPTSSATVHGDPYRSPASASPALSGLSIRTRSTSDWSRALAVGLTVAFGAWSAHAALFGPLGSAIGMGALGAWGAWETARSWRGHRTVRADHVGLHWEHRARLALRWSARSLPREQILQLYTRRHTLRDENGEVAWFAVYVRDVARIDHEIVTVDTVEQAWWIEQRLEAHLDIPDHRVDGDHRPPELERR